MAGQNRQVDHRLGMITAFHFIGIQQLFAGLTLYHQRHFPGQVEGIPHTAVVTLALPYRHDVGRIARQHNPALAELAGQACVVGVHAATDQVYVVGVRDHFFQQLAHVFRLVQLLFGFTRHHHEFETADAVGQRGRNVRALGVSTQVDVRRGQRVVGDIHHNPLVRCGLTVKTDTQVAAYIAVAAVAGDQVIGTNGFFFAFRRIGHQGDPAAVLGELLDITGEQHLHVAEAAQALVKHGIYLGLDEGVPTRPTEFIGHRLDISKAAALGGQKAHGMVRCSVRQHFVDQPDGLDGTQGLVVDTNGTGVIDQLVQLLDDKNVHACLAEIVGDGQAHGACAQNCYFTGIIVGLLGTGHENTLLIRSRAPWVAVPCQMPGLLTGFAIIVNCHFPSGQQYKNQPVSLSMKNRLQVHSVHRTLQVDH